GYPDAIVVNFARHSNTQIAAVERGRADAVFITGPFSWVISLAEARRVARAHAPGVYSVPVPESYFLFLNVHEPPFNDVRVRQALNYAIDRRRVAELAGGGDLARLSCQVIPPGLPGYAPACPFTSAPTPAGNWSAPDLVKARSLVAASGTGGARIQIW